MDSIGMVRITTDVCGIVWTVVAGFWNASVSIFHPHTGRWNWRLYWCCSDDGSNGEHSNARSWFLCRCWCGNNVAGGKVGDCNFVRFTGRSIDSIWDALLFGDTDRVVLGHCWFCDWWDVFHPDISKVASAVDVDVGCWMCQLGDASTSESRMVRGSDVVGNLNTTLLWCTSS